MIARNLRQKAIAANHANLSLQRSKLSSTSKLKTMVQITTKSLKLAEFLLLPETEPVSEYINGQIIQKPLPQGKHSTIQGELVTTVNAVVKPQHIAWAFPELLVPSANSVAVQIRLAMETTLRQSLLIDSALV
jgi:Putative restriction endonuclease